MSLDKTMHNALRATAAPVPDPRDERMWELECALREIEARTAAYRGDYDSWPKMAGLNEAARIALGSAK